MIYLIILAMCSVLYSPLSYSEGGFFDDFFESYDESDFQNGGYYDYYDDDGSSSVSLPSYRDTNGKETLFISISDQAFGAYDQHGDLIRSGRVSTAKSGYNTKTGTFTNLYKRGRTDCWSNKYKVNIPYCMFYHEGYAVHGFHHVPNRPASKGCIRMTISDARWVYDWVDPRTVLVVD